MPFWLHSGGGGGGGGYINGSQWFVNRCTFLSFGMRQGILGMREELTKNLPAVTAGADHCWTTTKDKTLTKKKIRHATTRRMLWFDCLLHPLEPFLLFLSGKVLSQANDISLYFRLYMYWLAKKGDGELNLTPCLFMYSTACTYHEKKKKKRDVGWTNERTNERTNDFGWFGSIPIRAYLPTYVASLAAYIPISFRFVFVLQLSEIKWRVHANYLLRMQGPIQGQVGCIHTNVPRQCRSSTLLHILSTLLTCFSASTYTYDIPIIPMNGWWSEWWDDKWQVTDSILYYYIMIIIIIIIITAYVSCVYHANILCTDIIIIILIHNSYITHTYGRVYMYTYMYVGTELSP